MAVKIIIAHIEPLYCALLIIITTFIAPFIRGMMGAVVDVLGQQSEPAEL